MLGWPSQANRKSAQEQPIEARDGMSENLTAGEGGERPSAFCIGFAARHLHQNTAIRRFRSSRTGDVLCPISLLAFLTRWNGIAPLPGFVSFLFRRDSIPARVFREMIASGHPSDRLTPTFTLRRSQSRRQALPCLFPLIALVVVKVR